MLEKIQNLCKLKGITLTKLERDLDFSRGSLYKWDTNSPSVDKVQKVADFLGVSVDFLISGYDDEMINIIKSLSKTDKTYPYFSEETLAVMIPEIEALKKVYWDVPLDTDPIELISLIRNTPLSSEFKNDLLNVLKTVKENVDSKDVHLDTIAAHLEGKNITPKKLKLIEQYIEALFEDDDE